MFDMFYVDETESWETSFEKENDGKLKFPISIHEVSVLENLGEISESVTYVAPKLKPTRTTTVDISKNKNNKPSKGKLF